MGKTSKREGLGPAQTGLNNPITFSNSSFLDNYTRWLKCYISDWLLLNHDKYPVNNPHFLLLLYIQSLPFCIHMLHIIKISWFSHRYPNEEIIYIIHNIPVLQLCSNHIKHWAGIWWGYSWNTSEILWIMQMISSLQWGLAIQCNTCHHLLWHSHAKCGNCPVAHL